MPGTVLHVLSRAARRARLFSTPADYDDFERILVEVQAIIRPRILAFCLMPTHWHLVVWPREPEELSTFMHRVTGTHARRVHANRGTTGTGPLYQGRYKGFLIQSETTTPGRAGTWSETPFVPTSCVGPRTGAEEASGTGSKGTGGPLALPARWTELVNEPHAPEELEALRRSVQRGTPYGSDSWVLATKTGSGTVSGTGA